MSLRPATEVRRHLFQQSQQFGALGGVQPADRAFFQCFPGGFDFGLEGVAGFGCLDEYCASVGGIRRPGDVAGALESLKHFGHGGGVDAQGVDHVFVNGVQIVKNGFVVSYTIREAGQLVYLEGLDLPFKYKLPKFQP